MAVITPEQPGMANLPIQQLGAKPAAVPTILSPTDYGFQEIKTDQPEVKPVTIEEKLPGLLSKENPLMQAATTGAMQQANARGLLNSSMAVGAGEKAVIDTAMDIAKPDAAAANALLANKQAFGFNAAMQDAETSNKYGLIGAETDAKVKLNQKLFENEKILSQMGLDSDVKRTVNDNMTKISQQYMVEWEKIVNSSDLTEESKNSRLNALQVYRDQQMQMQLDLAGMNMSAFPMTTPIGTPAPAGGTATGGGLLTPTATGAVAPYSVSDQLGNTATEAAIAEKEDYAARIAEQEQRLVDLKAATDAQTIWYNRGDETWGDETWDKAATAAINDQVYKYPTTTQGMIDMAKAAGVSPTQALQSGDPRSIFKQYVVNDLKTKAGVSSQGSAIDPTTMSQAERNAYISSNLIW